MAAANGRRAVLEQRWAARLVPLTSRRRITAYYMAGALNAARAAAYKCGFWPSHPRCRISMRITGTPAVAPACAANPSFCPPCYKPNRLLVALNWNFIEKLNSRLAAALRLPALARPARRQGGAALRCRAQGSSEAVVSAAGRDKSGRHADLNDPARPSELLEAAAGCRICSGARCLPQCRT